MNQENVRYIVLNIAIQIFQREDTKITNKHLFSLISDLFQFINCIGTSKAAYVSLFFRSSFRRDMFCSSFTKSTIINNELITTNINNNPLKLIDSFQKNFTEYKKSVKKRFQFLNIQIK